MPERYVDAILRYLKKNESAPRQPHQLARQMGVAEEDWGTFREAVKLLRDRGELVLGAKDALILPEIAARVVGTFRATPRGFGFVIPDTPNAHGDLFVPPDATSGAMTGDRVVASARSRGKRHHETVYEGEIVQILRRGRSRFVGTVEQAEGAWFVIPEGKGMLAPILVSDVGAAGPKPGTKVVAEIIRYAERGEMARGVIVERLGESGPLEIETLGVIRAHGFAEAFSPEALEQARAAVDAFDPAAQARVKHAGREDLTGETIITIDPPDARDFDDAISLASHRDGTATLGVHIADVSEFVPEGSPLDVETRARGTSVYFPRRVLPMLPEVLSNGVCSLQQGQPRYCKSVFITYGRSAEVLSTRIVESVISSAKRLTYEQAQRIIDGNDKDCPPAVAGLLRRMEKLARAIEARRIEAGSIELDLPEVSLVFDSNDAVIDAVPQEQSYTHKIIEMFMVEANEAVARLLDGLDRPFLRRVHPSPDVSSTQQLTSFVRACGHKLPRDLDRRAIQALLRSVKGRPESYAVNLAILRMFQQAEYSPMRIGHFALASANYCHFTSPIRRYPDLTVHRLITEYCRGRLRNRPPEDIPALVELGEHCSATERLAETAEDELRSVLLLQHLATKVGESFEGVITGVANFGIFVQSPRYLIDGMVRIESLGDDWWELDARFGHVRGERTGKTYRIGDLLEVRIAAVDVARRKLDLVPEHAEAPSRRRSGGPRKAGGRGKAGRRGRADAEKKGKKQEKARKETRGAKAGGKGKRRR